MPKTTPAGRKGKGQAQVDNVPAPLPSTPVKPGNVGANQEPPSPHIKTPEDVPSPTTPTLSFSSSKSEKSDTTYKQRIVQELGLEKSRDGSFQSTESYEYSDAAAQVETEELAQNGVTQIVSTKILLFSGHF